MINTQPVGAVGDVPGGIEGQERAFGQGIEVDLVGGIARAVVVGMGAVEVKDGRNAALGEVVVVAALVIVIGIVGRVVFVIGKILTNKRLMQFAPHLNVKRELRGFSR